MCLVTALDNELRDEVGELGGDNEVHGQEPGSCWYTWPGRWQAGSLC